MSTSIKVSWKCTCKPSTTTGWIDGDTENVYCNNCDGVITTLDKLKMTDIKRLDNIQKVIDADTCGEDMDCEIIITKDLPSLLEQSEYIKTKKD